MAQEHEFQVITNGCLHKDGKQNKIQYFTSVYKHPRNNFSKKKKKKHL